LFAGSLALAFAACASSSGGGSGGTNNSSGGNASGGSVAPAQGGLSGSNGGSSASGGVSSKGGSAGGAAGAAGSASGGASSKGGSTGGSTGASGGSGGSSGSAGSSTGAGGSAGASGSGSGGSSPGGSSGAGGTTGGGGTSGAAGSSGCTNTDTSKINEDASGYVCNNTLGIQGAWYCYNDGSDSTASCKGSDGKGAGAIPWNASSSAMCLSGTTGTSYSNYAGIGFKVNSGPPGSTATPGSWDASKLVGFAITFTAGASGKGTGGTVLYLEYPTTTDVTPQQAGEDAPGVTIPGVAGTAITYNVLFADAVLANQPLYSNVSANPYKVDPTKLTDVKIHIPYDAVPHSYDFCIQSVVPLTSAPNPVVATGTYGPAWTNQLAQAVNGINGYAVQSAPFITNSGNPMTMQVSATSDGVGFTYTPGSGFNAPNNGPGSFPAIISGWGPGEAGDQFYGPYQGGKQISQLTSVKSNWSFTMGSTGDAVYDVWFSNSSATPPSPGIELMVWIGNTGKNPLGSVASPGTAVGKQVPYVGTNGTSQQVVSYWVSASDSATSVSDFDLLPYFQDAAKNGYAGLKTSSYLLGIQTGFEVYSGSWSTTDYNITIQ
jgi:hypothetical protein